MGTWTPGPGPTSGNDTFIGDATSETANGGDGDDTLKGNDGDDWLEGGNGDDILHGDSGNDLIRGGAGNDRITDTGAVLNIDGGDGDDIVNLLELRVPVGMINGGAGFDALYTENVLYNVTIVGFEALLVNENHWSTLTVAQLESLDSILRTNPAVPDIPKISVYDSGFLDLSEELGALGVQIRASYFGSALVLGAGNDTITGDIGDDFLDGGAGDDIIEGKAGNDILRGGAGNDIFYLVGGSWFEGVDQIEGGDGIDTLVFRIDGGSAGPEATIIDLSSYSLTGPLPNGTTLSSIERLGVEGGTGGETIRGGATANYINGGGGRDFIEGGAGDDVIVVKQVYPLPYVSQDRTYAEGRIDGGSGRDELQIAGKVDFVFMEALSSIEGIRLSAVAPAGSADWVSQVTMTNTLIAGLGAVTVYAAAAPSTFTINTNRNPYISLQVTDLSGWTFNNFVAGRDTVRINGSVTDDRLVGSNAHDEIYGLGGNDTLLGGGGADKLFGGVGDDWLDGGAGVDRLEGGDNSDTYIVDDADDQVIEARGTAGLDTIQTTLTSFNLTTAPNVERLIYTGASNFTGTGGADADTIISGAGNDLLLGAGGNDLLIAGGGADRLEGGDGNDWAYGGAGDDFMFGGGGADYLIGESGNEWMYAGDGADWLYGGDGDDIMIAEGGDDVLNGDAGRDWLYAGVGNDRLFGGDGMDVLLGEDGDDRLDGGADGDALYGGAGNDFILAGEGDDWIDAGDGADWVYGGNGGELIIGGGGDDVLLGEAGVDWLYGGDGRDWIYAGDADDLLIAEGGDDVLQGEAGNDWLYGGAGNDFLIGGVGDDVLLGEAGDDTFFTGAGRDFVYFGDGADTLEFDAAQSGGAVVFGYSRATGDVLKLVGTGFTSTAQALAAATQTSDGVLIQLDANSSFLLVGVQLSSLSVADFVLG